MTTKEQIAVMQAYEEGKQIQWCNRFSHPMWVDTNEPIWNWEELEYRVKPEVTLPKTWKEFCEAHPKRKGECFVSGVSDIILIESGDSILKRVHSFDRNLLPNRQTAEAMLALCQLIQLRDCYNDGWKPDWSADYVVKYVIYVNCNEISKTAFSTTQQILAFKTAELRDEFFENFKELIETAKELL